MTVERQGRRDDDKGGRGGVVAGDLDVLQELQPGEQVLWSGRPRQGLLLRWSDALTIPFSLVWCSGAIFWEAMAITKGAPLFFRLWGVPFVLVGVYIVIGRFVIDAMARARTRYAVTDRRVLIASGLLRKSVHAINLRGLTEMEIVEGRRGRGTIIFGPTSLQATIRTTMLRGWPGAGRSLLPAFDSIDAVRQVLAIIQKAQEPL
jgi:hypothetical protein